MANSQIESLDAASSTLTLALDTELYPRDVLYAAAYVFIDRAYVLLDRRDGRYVVSLRGKQALDEVTLRAMAGEFENELLAQALRACVGRANQRIIEEVTALAIGGATARGTAADAAVLDLRNPGDDGFVADPRGLGAPWEDEKESQG
jgi:His-Xaa-Ser system protein HxsD